MNTIGWRVETPEETFFLALHGNTALLAKRVDREDVWQFRGLLGITEAIDRLVYETSEIEKSGGRVSDPVEFDLTIGALDQIYHRGTKYMDWFYAPQLRQELIYHLWVPPAWPSGSGLSAFTSGGGTKPSLAAAGDMYLDTATGTTHVFDGSGWLEMVT